MRKMRATRARAIKDSYFTLVKQFPVRRIRTDAEHKTATEIIRRLSLRGEANLDKRELDYLDALAEMVVSYERTRWPIPKASPLEMLKHLMEENNMRPSDLGSLIGSRANATLILQGQRELSKAHIRILAERFNVSPALLL